MLITDKNTLISDPYPTLEAACRALGVCLESSPIQGPLLFVAWQDPLGGYHFGLPQGMNASFTSLFHQWGHDGMVVLRHMTEAAATYREMLLEEVPGPDEGMLGLGIAAAAVRVPIGENDTREDVEARIAANPELEQKTMFVHLITRDGLGHSVEHAEGEDQTYFSTFGNCGIAGPMAVEMARLLNAFVPEDIPIPHAEGPAGFWASDDS